jgi:peptidoglycan biosynthesis protein MviN/MurJ (putative lipid II flippase)
MADRSFPWRLLGFGGVASLCCVGGGAVGGTALASGAVAGGLGAGVAQVLVTVATVAVLGLAWRWRRSGVDGECDRS